MEMVLAQQRSRLSSPSSILQCPWIRSNGPRSKSLVRVLGPGSRSVSTRLHVCASLPVQNLVQISSTLFTLATTLVMPFYTIMILAPRKAWTKRVAESNIPHIILGVVYTYLLAISWSPNTLQYMFASKYYLPELPGITQMFSSTLTVASAWVHLLAADLFVGRQIFLEGLEHNVETRHSLVLCLMFCPVGMLSHILTKVITLSKRVHEIKSDF